LASETRAAIGRLEIMQLPENTASNLLAPVLEAWPLLAATAAFGTVAGILLY
jgi:hypothetical protein